MINSTISTFSEVSTRKTRRHRGRIIEKKSRSQWKIREVLNGYKSRARITRDEVVRPAAPAFVSRYWEKQNSRFVSQVHSTRVRDRTESWVSRNPSIDLPVSREHLAKYIQNGKLRSFCPCSTVRSCGNLIFFSCEYAYTHWFRWNWRFSRSVFNFCCWHLKTSDVADKRVCV